MTQNRRLSVPALALLGLCVALVGLDVFRTWQERQDALADAGAQTGELAHALAEQMHGVLLSADSVLLDLRERIETDGTAPALLARAKRVATARAATLPMLHGFFLYDGLGHGLIDPLPGPIGHYSVADRAFFVQHRDHPGRALAIGLPVHGRSSGRWAFTLSRRIDRPDGSFGGVVEAAVDIDWMRALYSDVALGRHSVVTLFRSDGPMLLRYPPADPRPNDASANAAFFGTLVAPSATVSGRSTYDGVDRVLAYRRLTNYPLIIFVGLGRTEILAKWRQSAIVHLVGVLILAMAVALLGNVLMRQSRRRHVAELAAAAAATEYRLLADYATDMILRVREGGQRVYASPACRTLLGYTPEQMLQRRWQLDIHPDDVSGLQPKWGEAPDTPTIYTHRMRRRDGSYVWVEATSRSLPRGRFEPLENLVVVRDISLRQEVAARLQEANRLLQRAEAITHLGHWRFDLVTQALFWSEEVFRISGWPLDQVPNLQTAIEVYHPDDRAQVSALVQQAIDTGEAYRFDLRLVRPDGAIRHVVSHGEPEYAEDGRMLALVGTFQDVTESVELEATLRHRQKLEAIGQLAAGMAHDFNNILQGVLGGLELVIGDMPPHAAMRECAEVAFASAQRGASLTHQLLSFARKQVLVPRGVPVAPLLAELRALLSRTLGPHIVVETAAAGALPAIFVDPDHLHTALLNLAINAGHAMPQGGRLRIEVAPEPASSRGAGWVTIAVVDTGSGMTPATLARATDPFFTTKGPVGTGLGLPMVQGFARQSGGDLRLFSVPGQGTRAELVLPSHLAGMSPTEAEAGRAPRGPARILLVDDVPDVLFAAGLFLEKSGLQVATAESGDAALALLASGARFDALVTDYAMPGLNGVDLVALAREIQPGLPALIITGFAEIDIDRIAQVTAVMRKPFRRQQLVDAVLELLQEPDVEEPAPPAGFAPPVARL